MINQNLHHFGFHAMDWFSWLSKTDLDPSLVHHYGHVFTRNELDRNDISYFSHEFLQSVGVSVAKHRLEILKLVRKEKRLRIAHPVAWLMLAIKQARKCLTWRARELVRRESTALAVVPVRNHSLRWKVTMLQRNKRSWAAPSQWGMIMQDNSPTPVAKPGMLMLTDGSLEAVSRNSESSQPSTWAESVDNAVRNQWNSSFSSTIDNSLEGGYSTEGIKWDAMFQNLNPT